ncbi:MAG: DNA recombination protein RmuC [Candidatus Marinimicrobia bacterium]|jgi:DNA recombination protein RmuC|nr:DNA recombination protein RmuC [Candidatus Neomarinimicrobiota bacterium]MBT3618349.1 DNA recombination protein RmuC [Candidatus Neomarinimicrobiota bacterium]MBT3829144.1 DNA recombination protein RmuC [Candidatus Neomarinimicrobiota bacterium]MBT3998112.1 DNA recombination protein RmuC [Candidatus Neomarinimicrobiota bacterium]MBT4281453.1 DNA recombination protein RmuC [Candidatus Neomarinimicrobiota bacterium]
MTSILFFLAGLLLGGGIIWFVRQKEIDSAQTGLDQLKDVFGNLSKEALTENQKSFFELAENKFAELMKSSETQLDEKKKLIDSTLMEMGKNLDGLTKSTSELKGQMEESKKGIDSLSDTTSRLRQILSSSQARGQWGERMVEDILSFIGLIEGINYEKQSQEGKDRPDFKFNLPDGKHINMDVKFPLTHYENYLATDVESERDDEKKAFLKDVRNHVKEISGRSYIDPNAGTVDYVLMFIPNESIYSFLNQEDGELIDFSLGKKILLCSPVTLYAFLSLIRQAVSNFHMEQRAGEMQKLVNTFRDQWGKFADQVSKLGKTLGTLSNHYDELSGPRLRALEKPMEKIEDLQIGLTDESALKELPEEEE